MATTRARRRRQRPVTPGRVRRTRVPCRDERGSSPVELAITAPAILLLLFASIQVAIWFLARDVALTAAQEAVTAQRGYNAPDGVGKTRADNFLATAGDWLVNPQVTVTRNGDDVQATVTGTSLRFVFTFGVRETVHGTVEHITTAP